MFTRAIELDDTYGAAYADRARVRIARFVEPRRRERDEPRRRARRHRAGAEVCRRHADVLVRAAGLAFLVDRDLPRALGLIEAAEQVGPLDRRPAADEGQLPDVCRSPRRVAGRAGPGGPARPGQRWHLSILGARTSPRRTVPARWCACWRTSIRGSRAASTGASTCSPFTGVDQPLVGRSRAAARRRRAERDAVGRVRPAALRGAARRTCARCWPRRRPPSSRSTARSARGRCEPETGRGATRLGAAARSAMPGRGPRRRRARRLRRAPAEGRLERVVARGCCAPRARCCSATHARAIEQARAATASDRRQPTPSRIDPRPPDGGARARVGAARTTTPRRCSRRSRAATRASAPRPSCAIPSSASRSRRTHAGDRWRRR